MISKNVVSRKQEVILVSLKSGRQSTHAFPECEDLPVGQAKHACPPIDVLLAAQSKHLPPKPSELVKLPQL